MGDYRRGGFRGGRIGCRPGIPGDMHKAICVDCGQETEVPFQLFSGRPVYCRECYQSHIPKRY